MGSPSLAEVDAEAGDRHYQAHPEQHLGDAGRTRGDAAETEHGGNEGDDEEDDGVVQHDVLLEGRRAVQPRITSPL